MIENACFRFFFVILFIIKKIMPKSLQKLLLNWKHVLNPEFQKLPNKSLYSLHLIRFYISTVLTIIMLLGFRYHNLSQFHRISQNFHIFFALKVISLVRYFVIECCMFFENYSPNEIYGFN